jgi:hypothetical protein
MFIKSCGNAKNGFVGKLNHTGCTLCSVIRGLLTDNQPFLGCAAFFSFIGTLRKSVMNMDTVKLKSWHKVKRICITWIEYTQVFPRNQHERYQYRRSLKHVRLWVQVPAAHRVRRKAMPGAGSVMSTDPEGRYVIANDRSSWLPE